MCKASCTVPKAQILPLYKVRVTLPYSAIMKRLGSCITKCSHFWVLTMKRFGGQTVPAFGALHNAASVQAKICEAVGALGLIFHNRISFMWWVSVVVDDLHSVNKHLSLGFKLRLENALSNNCFYIQTLLGLLLCNIWACFLSIWLI